MKGRNRDQGREPPKKLREKLDVEQFFEYARQREERPQLKPLNFTFEPARRPEMMMPERPRADVRAAETAMREIKEYASKARDMYRERRQNERPAEAREYVRHQLALGMLETPSRRSATKLDTPLRRGEGRYLRDRAEERDERPTRKDDRAKSLFGLWRKRPRDG